MFVIRQLNLTKLYTVYDYETLYLIFLCSTELNVKPIFK